MLLASADTIQRIMEETLGPSSTPVSMAMSTSVPPVAHAAAENSSDSLTEIPNLLTFLNHFFHNQAWMKFLEHFENQFFAILIAIIICIVAYFSSRKRSLIPHPLQNFMEWVVEMLDTLVCDTIGSRGRKYTPFIGTLFIYIFSMNIAGLIPFMKAPTADINTTLALALCVFFYVQWTAIKENGLLGYIDHLAGQPRDLITWGMVILMFPLHILEELIKPVSLSLRLFGNILGEDLLLGAFLGLGIICLSFIHSPIGIPLHFPLLFLALLTCVIQALVFSLLSTIYILLMLPHEEEHEANAQH